MKWSYLKKKHDVENEVNSSKGVERKGKKRLNIKSLN